jgi:hypothetical protein
MNLKFGLFLCFGAMLSNSAYARVVFGIKGGVNLNTGSVKIGSTSYPIYKYGVGYMGGIGLDLGRGPMALGIDVFYAQRIYGFQNAVALNLGGTVVNVSGGKNKTSDIFIPVQAKISLMRLIKLGLGIYYSIPAGDQKIHNSAGTEIATAKGASDYGAVASLGVNISKISIEARYNFGLVNQTGGAQTTKLSHVDLVAGLRF